MNKGDVIQEKQGKLRTGLVTDYDSDGGDRWCEIMWSDGHLECFDSLIPDWDKWETVEVISETR